MIDPQARVCPRCGSPGGETQFCGTCGLNLFEQPELPTRAQWDERQAHETPVLASTGSGATTPTGVGGGIGRWLGRPTPPQRVLLGLVLIVIIAVPIAVATSGGDESGDDGDSAEIPVDAGPSDAETCVDRWNSGATENAKRLIGNFARSFRTDAETPTYVSAGVSADVPDRCLITIAQPDVGQGGIAYQYTETAQGTFEFPSGGSLPISALPESVKQWNARGDSAGEITLGAP
jgi:hypothetical protein